jgi:adenine-specific DNA-methyltransferase
MATSVPQRKENKLEAANGNALGLTLVYEGKRECGAILATPPATLHPVWSSVAPGEPTLNQLIWGENLSVLSALAKDPRVRGKVRLVYIDPPYATGGVFQSRLQEDAYDDLLIGAHYVEFIRERLILLRELLAEDGSIYVHLDKNMAFAIKMIMDEVFGVKNFRNWITRKKCNPKNYTSKSYGNVADFILFYTKTDEYVWNRPFEEWTDAKALKEYQYTDEQGRRYKKVPIHAPGVRNGETGQEWRGMQPPLGKHWQYTPTKLEEMDARGEIYWSPTGNPRRKVYLDTSAGIPIQDIWLEYRDAHNQNIKITGFPTEKNAGLLERIIEASSHPGDLVLDCFAGSGTTLAVASHLNRQWIGIDSSKLAIATTLQRFACGLKPMGDFASAKTLESFDQTFESFGQAKTLEPFDQLEMAFPSEGESNPHISESNQSTSETNKKMPAFVLKTSDKDMQEYDNLSDLQEILRALETS